MIAGMCRGLTGFWCTDGYAVCSYAGAAATSKDIVVSMDDVGVSKTPGLRVNAPPSVLADLTFHGLFRSKAAWLELQPLKDEAPPAHPHPTPPRSRPGPSRSLESSFSEQ